MEPNEEQLVQAIDALAHGEEHALEGQIRANPAWLARLKTHSAMVAAASLRFFDAPLELRARAADLMPARRAGILRTTFGLAGARSAETAFQSVLELGDAQLRVLYSPEEGGWAVMGECSAPIEVEGVSSVDGSPERFAARFSQLEDATFLVVVGDEEWVIPAPELP